VFVKIVGVNAGAGLLAQLNGAVALKMFIVGFSGCSVRPLSSGSRLSRVQDQPGRVDGWRRWRTVALRAGA
jgi:hypothetical protein